MTKNFLLKSFLALATLMFLGACSEISDVDFDELESIIEDKLPGGDPEDVEQQNLFCSGVVATKSSALNVRTSPEISDNICTKLEKGTPVVISMAGGENGFLKIQTTRCGDEMKWVYVSEKFIEIDENCEDEFEEEGEFEEEAVIE